MKSAPGPGAQRLQKLMSQAGLASRRKAEELIRQGRVTVNGRVAELGERADPTRDAVKVDGKRLQPPVEQRYLLLQKPRGYVSTTSDPQGRSTVLDLVPARLRKGLHPVGRLDFNTEGLLLLTTDGELSQRIAHPRHGCTKVYEVKVKGRPEEHQLQRLRDGIVLDGRRTAPCRIEPRKGLRGESTNSWWTVTLTEGRTRQIRQMFQRIGHPAQRLRRIAIGSLRDPRLPVGEVRELSEKEVRELRKGGRRSRPRRRT